MDILEVTYDGGVGQSKAAAQSPAQAVLSIAAYKAPLRAAVAVLGDSCPSWRVKAEGDHTAAVAARSLAGACSRAAGLTAIPAVVRAAAVRTRRRAWQGNWRRALA